MQATPVNVGPSMSPRTPTATIAPGVYSYDEAVMLGIDVGPTPEELGLPACEPDTAYAGLTEGEVVPLDAEPACAVDPTTIEFGIGLPVPHSGPGGDNGAYHFAGYRTTGEYAGAYAEIEVQNPAVDHVPLGTDDEFVASRILTQETANSNWL
jgi:hypothetical protein